MSIWPRTDTGAPSWCRCSFLYGFTNTNTASPRGKTARTECGTPRRETRVQLVGNGLDSDRRSLPADPIVTERESSRGISGILGTGRSRGRGGGVGVGGGAGALSRRFSSAGCDFPEFKKADFN